LRATMDYRISQPSCSTNQYIEIRCATLNPL
jgi:hypothetical protein